MIQELKRTAITFNGVDGWEVLIKDDEIQLGDKGICERCMYRDWREEKETLTPCNIVYRCIEDWQTYFEFKTEPAKQYMKYNAI